MDSDLTHSRTDAELIDFADEHLVYEGRMLVYSVFRMRQIGRKGPEMNAFLESFVVHTRCLQDFIWGIRWRKKPEDAFASDYCKPGEWEKHFPPIEYPPDFDRLPPTLASIRKDGRVGQEVVHLSYSRLDVGQGAAKNWPPGVVLGEIAVPLAVLADLAMPERMNDATRIALRDLETHLPDAGAASVATGANYGGTISFPAGADFGGTTSITSPEMRP